MSADPVAAAPPVEAVLSLDGRYETRQLASAGRPVQLLAAYDTVLQRSVSLLLLPRSTSLSERLALRLQLRHLAGVQHLHLAHIFDVVDSPAGLAVVVESLPGAVLLSDLPANSLGRGDAQRVVTEVGEALAALREAGLAHGAVSTSAVALTPDRRALLLPLPTRTDARPADDVDDLSRLVTEIEASSLAAAEPRSAGPGAATRTADRRPGSTPSLPSVPSAVPSEAGRSARDRGALRASGSRLALVLAGGFGGALLADVVAQFAG